MKRLDYYIIMIALFVGAMIFHFTGEETYAGMFIGVFIAEIKSLLNIGDSEKEDIEMEDMKVD